MEEQTQTNELKEKQLAFYSAIVDAYVQTSLERDRSLLNLSVGAIGLLVTLLTTVGAQSFFVITLYIFSFLFFTFSIILILRVFNLNKIYLLQLANNESIDEPKFKKYDRAIYWFFLMGIIFSSSIGITNAIIHFK
jgi:hypothetical protein